MHNHPGYANEARVNCLQMDVNRDIDLQTEVTTHAGDTGSIGILQTGEMVLIDFVEEILAREGELDAIMPKEVQIHPRREI